jgi:hypothetical protein
MVALGGMTAALVLGAHQGRTQEESGEVVIPILSTTDVVGYTSPCG